jgi:hypothetical protein
MVRFSSNFGYPRKSKFYWVSIFSELGSRFWCRAAGFGVGLLLQFLRTYLDH